MQQRGGALARNAKDLQKAQTPAAHMEANRLREQADKTLAEAEDLKQQARLEDLQVWEMEKVKEFKKGSKNCRKLSRAKAIRKAKERKAKALALLHLG